MEIFLFLAISQKAIESTIFIITTMKDTAKEDDYTCMSLPDLLGDGEPHTWKELKEIESRRRAILKRVEMPFWRILGYWDGTCLKVLVHDALLWATLAVYIAVRVATLTGHLPAYMVDLEDTNIDIIGGFLSFFLVLFVNQANTRFSGMYHESMACTERIEDVACIVSAYLPKANANRLVRYLNAAHAAAYVGLASDTYSTRSFFLELNTTYKFLTEKEMKRVAEIGMEQGAESMRELLMWAIKEVHVVQEAKIIDARMSGEIRDKIQKFRCSMSSLYHGKDQPIHFFYIHFLCLLTAFYLPLFAIATAYGVGGGEGEGFRWMSEILSFLIVFIQAVFVIGLRLLGQVMVDPYGDDLEDLSVMHYVEHTWKSSNRILSVRFPDDVDPSAEEENIKTRAQLGGAWDTLPAPQPVLT